jgi:hypothetical protein
MYSILPFRRWCFTFDGQVVGKDLTKILRDRLDDELIFRLQHRDKQGLVS